jgi:Tol biopolymer transport system component
MSSRPIAFAVVVGVALSAATSPAAATFPGRNGDIAFVHSDQIYLIRPDGTHLRRLTDSPTDKFSPSFSADGRKIAFAHLRRVFVRGAYFQISVMDADGRHHRQLTHARADSTSPTFSGDGRTIAFSRRTSVWAMDPDGSHPRLVTKRGQHPAFSPDGRRIVFDGWDTRPDDEATPREKEGIFVVDADGRRRRELTRNPMSGPDPAGNSMPLYRDHDPSFAPDGKHIVFLRSPAGCLSGDVYVMSTSGKHVHALTHPVDGCGNYEDATFSPDGRLVLTDGPYVMHADGTHRRKLPGLGYSPDWQPLSR